MYVLIEVVRELSQVLSEKTTRSRTKIMTLHEGFYVSIHYHCTVIFFYPFPTLAAQLPCFTCQHLQVQSELDHCVSHPPLLTTAYTQTMHDPVAMPNHNTVWQFLNLY